MIVIIVMIMIVIIVMIMRFWYSTSEPSKEFIKCRLENCSMGFILLYTYISVIVKIYKEPRIYPKYWVKLYKSIKRIKKLSRGHFLNSFDVSEILG